MTKKINKIMSIVLALSILCGLLITTQAEEITTDPFPAISSNSSETNEETVDLGNYRYAKLSELIEKYPDQYSDVSETEEIDPDLYLNLMQIIDYYKITDMDTFIDLYLQGGFPAFDNITVDEYGLITVNPVPFSMTTMSVNTTGSDVSRDKINRLYSYSLNNTSNIPQYADQTSDMHFVDPLTGNLTVRQTDLVLPGRDGFDLNISRYYNSAQAEFHAKKVVRDYNKVIDLHKGDVITTAEVDDLETGERITEYYVNPHHEFHNKKTTAINKLGYLEDKDRYIAYPPSSRVKVDNTPETFTFPYYYSTKLEPLTYQRMRNNLGAGWSFGFPSIQIIRDDLNSDNEENGIYFHTGTGSVYTVVYDVFKRDYVFSESTDSDYHLEIAMSNTPSGGVKYTYTNAEKTVYSFGVRGQLLSMVDRFGNEINFEYTTIWIYGVNSPQLYKITDTVGRTVQFTYSNNNTMITVTVTDPKNINHTLTFSYEKEMVNTQTINGISCSEPVLKTFTNPMGEVTRYQGETRNIDFTFNGKTLQNFSVGQQQKNYYLDKQTVKTYFLTNILYPHSAAVFEFTDECQEYFSPDWVVNDPVYLHRNLGVDGITKAYRYYHTGSTNISDINNTSIYDRKQYKDRFYNCFENQWPWIDYTGYPEQYSTKILSENVYRTSYTDEAKRENCYKIADIYNPHLVLRYESVMNYDINNFSSVLTSYDDFFEGRMPQLVKTRIMNNSGLYETYSEISYYGYSDEINGYQKNKVKYQSRPLLSDDFNDTNKRLDHSIFYEKYKYGNVSETSWNQSLYPLITNREEAEYANGRISKVSGETSTAYSYVYTDGMVSKRTLETYIETTSQMGIDSEKFKKVEEYYTTATNYAYPSEIREYYTDENGIEQYRSTNYTYDMLLGKVKTVTDINGTATYGYDLLGRITSETYPVYESYETPSLKGTYYAEKTYTYTSEQLTDIPYYIAVPVYTLKVVERLKYYKGLAVVFENEATKYYDGLGNMLRSTVPEIIDGITTVLTTNIRYNYNQQISTVTDPLGNQTNVYYDFLGRITQITDPSGTYVNEYETEILTNGTKARSYVVSGPVTEITQDIYGRTIKQSQTIDNEEIESLFEYDLSGNLVSYTDPNKNLNSHRVTERYEYSQYNRLVYVTNAKDEGTSYSYDGLGNITYSSIGNQAQFNKKYNELSAVIEDKDQLNKFQTNKYDMLGRLSESEDRNGVITSLLYDEMNNLSEMSTTNGTVQTGTVRKYSNTTPFGRDKIFDGSSTITNTYSKLGSLLSKTLSYPNYSATISNTFDKIGRLTRFSAAGKHTNYSYQ